MLCRRVKTTNFALDRSAVNRRILGMAKKTEKAEAHDQAYWLAEAAKIGDTLNPLSVPYAVALQEATSLSSFLRTY